MRKIWIFASIAFIIGAFFTTLYFLAIPLGKPMLKVEFNPNPPWNVESGRNLTVSIKIVNNAWLFAMARNVSMVVTAPENFLVHGTDTNEYNLHFDMLRGGEAQNNTLTLTVPHVVSSGNYTVTIRVLAENVPEQTFTAQIIVEQTVFIP